MAAVISPPWSFHPALPFNAAGGYINLNIERKKIFFKQIFKLILK